MKRMFKKLFINIMIILVLFFIVVIVFNVKRGIPILDKIKYLTYKEGRDYFIDHSDYDNYLESIKSRPSEIEGMTIQDKVEAGLSPYNVDTDNDGLTDAEEIELGSDPTKMSTSGDLYPDGYKRSHDMDINTYYEYEPGTADLKYVMTDEATFDISCAEDWNGSIEVLELQESYKGVYRVYRLSGIKSCIELDMTPILEQNNVTMDDLAMYCRGMWDEGKLEDFHYVAEGNSIILEYEFCKQTKYIYIVNKHDYSIDDTEANEYRGIIFGVPGLRAFFNKSFNIWYSSSGNKDTDKIIEDYLMKEAEQVTDAGLNGGKEMSPENDNVLVKSKAEIDIRYKAMQYLLPMFECDSYKNMTYYQLLYYYSDLSDQITSNIKQEKILKLKRKSVFNMYKDTLPFDNFGSDINYGGHCAGFATLTARTFNGNYIPEKGGYDIKYTNGGYTNNGYTEWDLTGDEENKTLMDKGLVDYKDENFCRNHESKIVCINPSTNEEETYYILNNNLSNGEVQFRNLIGCLWAECNDNIRLNSDNVYLPQGDRLPYSKIQAVKKYLDQDKILIAGFGQKGLGGHAVNIVGYQEYANGDTKLFIYDNNFPFMDLYVKIQPRLDGTFDYYFETPTYVLDSTTDGHKLSICDDNFVEIK